MENNIANEGENIPLTEIVVDKSNKDNTQIVHNTQPKPSDRSLISSTLELNKIIEDDNTTLLEKFCLCCIGCLGHACGP